MRVCAIDEASFSHIPVAPLSAGHDFLPGSAYEIVAPARQDVAMVFNSPHSGRHYPPRFLAMIRLDPGSIRRSEDCYVDELFGAAPSAGAPLLKAHFPRAYLDVNREPYELDPRMFVEPMPGFANVRSGRVAGGLGTVPRLVGEGLEIYAGRLSLSEALSRIEAVYRPYHEALRDLLMTTHRRFGHAALIDCHSMPAGVRTGESGVRPDFIVGDRYGAAADSELTDLALHLLAARGYAVAHNKPYAGGFITEHYGRPSRGLHALQIEVNRGLYMNERTYQKTVGYEALVRDLAGFVAALVRWKPAAGIRVAAE